MSDEIQQAIRIRARELLKLGEVGCVIGYEHGKRPMAGPGKPAANNRARPAFVYDPADADRLVWNESCTHNLVVYLHFEAGQGPAEQPRRRVALVAKPCDVRALNVLIHEGQVAREEVYVIGVACPGTVDEEGIQAQCRRCKERVPLFYDALVGKPPKVEAELEAWADVAEVEAMAPADRLAFWTREFERCIRCYACRQACPGCYCSECVAEQVDPPWLSIAHGVPQKAFFHVMRAYHLAGRCVECHACDAACPMHIPLSLLNRMIAREVKALFGSIAGADQQAVAPLATFRRDEEWPL